MVNTASDQNRAWVMGLQQGREDSFRSLYDAYERRLFAYAYYLLKSPDVAEEVVQEAFIRLWERRAKLDEETFLLPYLRKTIQNLAIDFFRKQDRDKALQEKIYTYFYEVKTSGAEQILEKELSRAYREAIDRLPPQQKKIYLLRRDGSLSYQQIADQAGIALNTARNHMKEAVKSIRQYIEHHTDLGCLALAIWMAGKR